MLPRRLPLLYEEFAEGFVEAPELDEGKNISYAYVWGRVPLHRRGREPTGGFSVSLAALGARPFFSRVPL